MREVNEWGHWMICRGEVIFSYICFYSCKVFFTKKIENVLVGVSWVLFLVQEQVLLGWVCIL